MLGYRDLIKKIDGKYFKGSCTYSDKNELQEILSETKPEPKAIVEIGTYHGLSTLVLAGICDVYTFDIKDYTTGRDIWNQFETKGKIIKYIVKDSNETKEILKDISFDWAFVDSVHDYENAKRDFDVVKKCGRVLFHDNFERFPGVMKFCNEINCERVKFYYGYWEGKV